MASDPYEAIGYIRCPVHKLLIPEHGRCFQCFQEGEPAPVFQQRDKEGEAELMSKYLSNIGCRKLDMLTQTRCPGCFGRQGLNRKG